MTPRSTRRDRRAVLKETMKALGGTVETLSCLERDPPLVRLAEIERSGGFDIPGLREAGNEVLRLGASVNDYRRRYWHLETNIRQGFLSLMKGRGYLPSSSREVESLKASLPEALIKGDDRVWKFSYDRYITTISGLVGRDPLDAPNSNEIWDLLERRSSDRINDLVSKANALIPQLIKLRARLRSFLGAPQKDWKDIRVRDPKVTPVRRPIRPVMIIRRPLPIQKAPRRPRKKLLGGPRLQVIGPGGEVR